jgi:N-acetyl-anhydromuramyl-L-alanine amidase AmpD
MTYSKLARAAVKESPQSSSRQGATVDMFIVHHCANTNTRAVIDMMTIPTKEVSANYVVDEDGVQGVVREELRAFTSGSRDDGGKGAAYDRRAITVETVNSSMGPDWRFDPRTIEHLARLIADVASRYGFPIDRDHVVGHRELYTRWGASYPTMCPGPSMDLDALVTKARAYQQNDTTQEEDDMVLYTDQDKKDLQAAHADSKAARETAERVEKRATNTENKVDAIMRHLGIPVPTDAPQK